MTTFPIFRLSSWTTSYLFRCTKSLQERRSMRLRLMIWFSFLRRRSLSSFLTKRYQQWRGFCFAKLTRNWWLSHSSLATWQVSPMDNLVCESKHMKTAWKTWKRDEKGTKSKRENELGSRWRRPEKAWKRHEKGTKLKRENELGNTDCKTLRIVHSLHSYSSFFTGYLNMKEAWPVIINRVAEKCVAPEEELSQNVFLFSRLMAAQIYAFRRRQTSKNHV